MLRFFAFIFVVSISVSIEAAECTAKKPENFTSFFRQFVGSKQFAISRTIYPLKIETSYYGVDAQGRDISGKTLKLRSAQEDAQGESLSVEMERNDLSFRILSLRKKSAVVNVSGKGDDLLLNHHFILIGNCWFQEKLEDYSL